MANVGFEYPVKSGERKFHRRGQMGIYVFKSVAISILKN